MPGPDLLDLGLQHSPVRELEEEKGVPGGAGRRLLAADLAAPLLDRPSIEARLGLVAWFHEDSLRRDRVRAGLKAMPDVARALGRLVAGRGGPRDLALLRRPDRRGNTPR